MTTVAEILGWTGSVPYILAYLLLCLKGVTSDSPFYHLLNIFGALGLIVNAFHWGNLPSVVVNIVWMGIAVLAIIVIIYKRIKNSGSAT